MQVLLKCNDSVEKKNLPKSIHQATVRRAVVVRHIQEMKLRGHKAYQHVNMERVREKANAELPDILLRDVQIEKNIQKMIIQRHATTVPEPTSDLKKVEHLLSVTVPNAVTMEKSSCDTVDYNSMYHNAFESVKAKVRGAEATATEEKPGSFFSAIRQEHQKNMSKHR